MAEEIKLYRYGSKWTTTPGGIENHATQPDEEAVFVRAPDPIQVRDPFAEAEHRMTRRTCACGYDVADCNPSRCSSSLARDALWGNS